MTKDVTLDFGLLIAYAVPGALGLAGFAYWSPLIRQLLHEARTASSTIGPLTIVIGLSVVLGMIISIVRAAWLDRTLQVNLRRGWFRKLPPHFGATRRCDPIFPALATKERLAAYLEAKASDKRPYQFYGNMLVALPLFVAGTINGYPSQLWGRPWSAMHWAAAVLVAATLYLAARQSHYRFMETVLAFNALAPKDDAEARAV